MTRPFEEYGAFCPGCKRADQIRRYPGATRRGPADGPRAVEVPCSCSACGAEWRERYELAGDGRDDLRDELLLACRAALECIEHCVEPSCDEGDELPDGSIHDGSTPVGNRLRAVIARANAARDTPEDPARARLNEAARARLNEAAPELLEVCRAVLADSEIGTAIELDGDPDDPVYDGDGAEWFTVGLIARLRAAIARATGAKKPRP